MNTGLWIIVILTLLMAGWFLVARVYNRRRGREVARQLSNDLQLFGTAGEPQFIGLLASAGKIDFQTSAPVYKSAEVYFLLEPRENPPLWLVNHLRGQRDEAVFRLTLKRSPSQEVEVTRSGDPVFKRIMSSQEHPYEQIVGPEGFEMARRGRRAGQLMPRVRRLLETYGKAISRISIRVKEPHLFVRYSLPSLPESQTAAFWSSVQELIEPVESQVPSEEGNS